MGMEDEVVRNAMVASDKSRKEGTKEVPISIPDPPHGGEVKAAPEIGKQRLTWNACIVVRRATRRVSAGRSAPFQKNPDPSGPNKKIGSRHTMSRDRKDSEKSERGKPS